MQEKYEQAIKETFKYLDTLLLKEPTEEKIEQIAEYILTNITSKIPIKLNVHYYLDKFEFIVIPEEPINLPIYIWREK